MLKIGITGQTGFIGKHLFNTIGLFPAEFERVGFEKSFFEHNDALDNFIKQCDIIVHLAAMNRHPDPEHIYQVNTSLVKKLTDSLVRTGSHAHVIFSSSTQEEKDNHYGQSKLAGRQMLAEWAKKHGGKFTGMVIPNVFGPFGLPFYNSVIATFCHQLTHEETPVIAVDGELNLIYIDELANAILDSIRSGEAGDQMNVPATSRIRVSALLLLLEQYKTLYLQKGIIPPTNNSFERNLFNTFRSFIDNKNYFPVKLTKHTDPRGAFVEIIRLGNGGQVSFSTTLPGVTRGNHFHTRKIERFAVIRGNALIQLRQVGTSEVLEFYLSGDAPAYVDMPVWYTHNIKNVGEGELYTIFWINEFFDPADPDTYVEPVHL